MHQISCSYMKFTFNCFRKLWDAITGKELASFVSSHIVKACDFSIDGTVAFSGGLEKTIRLFDLHKPDAEPLVCILSVLLSLCFIFGVPYLCSVQLANGHTAPVTKLVASADPNLFFSAGEEKDDARLTGLRVWDRRTLQLVKIINTEAPVCLY